VQSIHWVFVVTLLTLGCAVGRGEDHLPSAPPRARAANEKQLAALLSFEGQALEEDAATHTDFDYAVSNEFANHVFEAQIGREKGVYVAFGSLRALNVGSSGKFSHLVLMDYNRGMKLFNLLNLQLIARSADRFQYLSLLLTGECNEPLVEEARAGKISTAELIRRLSEPVYRQYLAWHEKKSDEYPDVFAKWRKLGVVLPAPADWSALHQARRGEEEPLDPLEPRVFHDFAGYARVMTEKGLIGNTYFGDDTRFATLRNLLAGGKVTVMNGDLAGGKSLGALGSALRPRGLWVSAVDLSNAPEYFSRHAPSPREAFAPAARSLGALPVRPQSRVLITAFAASDGKAGYDPDSWSYHALSWSQLPELKALYAERFQNEEVIPPPDFGKDYISFSKTELGRRWKRFRDEADELGRRFDRDLAARFPPLSKGK
jgi:hypothetical protein